MADMEALLAVVKDLPLLSHSARRLLALGNLESHSIQDVALVVEQDDALAMSVLRAANSAAAAPAQKHTAIPRAVNMVGERTVFCLAMAGGTGKVFEKPLPGYEAERGALWTHSLRSAVAARAAAAHSRSPVDPETAYACGLLHDIGKSVISAFLAKAEHPPLFYLAQEGAGDYLEAERASVGFDHAEVGQALALHWELAPAFVECIGRHHHPSLAPEELRSLVYVVHVGDMVAMMLGCGTGCDILRYPLDPGYPEHLRINSTELEKLIVQSSMEYERMERLTKGLFEGGKK